MPHTLDRVRQVWNMRLLNVFFIKFPQGAVETNPASTSPRPRTQVQRVQSFCVLFEGIIARQRELHVRAEEFAAEQAAMDTPISPRRGDQGTVESTGNQDVGAKNGVLGGAVAPGGGFSPSLGAVDQTFLFAMIWGLGGGLTGDPALAFDVYVRDLVQVSCISINRWRDPANDTSFSWRAVARTSAPGVSSDGLV